MLPKYGTHILSNTSKVCHQNVPVHELLEEANLQLLKIGHFTYPFLKSFTILCLSKYSHTISQWKQKQSTTIQCIYHLPVPQPTKHLSFPALFGMEQYVFRETTSTLLLTLIDNESIITVTLVHTCIRYFLISYIFVSFAVYARMNALKCRTLGAMCSCHCGQTLLEGMINSQNPTN